MTAENRQMSMANNHDDHVTTKEKTSSIALSAFLDSDPTPGIDKKSGSNTVAGDQMVKKVEKGEIFIRADGKKVRKVKKTVVRKGDAVSVSGAPDDVSVHSSSLKEKTLSSFLEASPKLGGNKISGSATVSGDRPSKNMKSLSGSASVVGDGEVYIRADGKKVRRVIKRVAAGSSSASVVDAATNNKDDSKTTTSATSATTTTTASTTEPNEETTQATTPEVEPSSMTKLTATATSLSSFLTDGANETTGSGKNKISAGSQSVDGDIIIRADGKKVRRIRKPVGAKSSATSVDGSSDAAPPIKKAALGAMLDEQASKKKKLGSAATVSGAESSPSKFHTGGGALDNNEEMGEIYINEQGKKVRRIRKSVATAAAASVTPAPAPVTTPDNTSTATKLSSFLATEDAAATKKLAKSGSATVSGETPLSKAKAAASTTAASEEGEIYIRADGKKVRRVKKSVAAAASATTDATPSTESNKENEATMQAPPATEEKKKSLGGFLDGVVYAKPKGGAATVAGDRLSSKKLDDGEVYIRADGKKVRRVRKPKADSDDEGPSTTADTKPEADTGLAAMLEKETPGKKKGAASVAGTPVFEGDIYINKDGKKVRRVRKPMQKDESSQDLVSGPPRLGSFLTAEQGAVDGKTKLRGSATVAGDTPSKSTSGITKPDLEGEIYIRADGKKVRRIKKPSGSSTSVADVEAKKSLGGFLDSSVKLKGGAASVAGDKIVSTKKLDDGGEIIIRPDGKKVLRRKKVAGDSDKPAAATAAGAGAAADGTPEYEVYRRADGKLVRRVKRQATGVGADTPMAAGDLANYLDVNKDKKPAAKNGNATVSGDMVAAAHGKVAPTKEGLLAGRSTITATKLPDPESSSNPEATDENAGPSKPDASLEMSSTKVAMSFSDFNSSHNKDSQQGLATKARSFGESTGSKPNDVPPTKPDPQESSSSTTTAATSPSLSPDDEAIAATYRKMKKMGLPDDVVRHKMAQDGVESHIAQAVLGESGVQVTSCVETELVKVPENKPTPQTAPRLDPLKKEEMSTPLAVKPNMEIELSTDEESIAASYRKMKRMGLPDDVVRHKMTQDEVDAKVVAAVLGDEWTPPASTKPATPAAPDLSAAPTAPASIELAPDEEATASSYFRMKKMGLPDDVVRHKMTQDGVEQKIFAAVLGDEWLCAPVQEEKVEATPVLSIPRVDTGLRTSERIIELTDEENEIASSYRKMKRMGLSEDAVRHKMTQEGIGSKIIASVFGDIWVPSEEDKKVSAPAPAPTPSKPPVPVAKPAPSTPEVKKINSFSESPSTPISPSALSPGGGGPNAVAYIVVVSDENGQPQGLSQGPKDRSLNLPPPIERGDGDDRSVKSTKSTVSPTEKFAVKVESSNRGKRRKGEDGVLSSAPTPVAETKFMTLAEISKVTGQSLDELENIVTEQRNQKGSAPRFVLQALEKKSSENLYEVEMPLPGASDTVPVPAAVAATTEAKKSVSGADKKNLKEIREGQEVVDSDLAKAARAVSALGAGDLASLLAKIKAGDMGALIERLQEAEKRQKKLEKQLTQAGVAIAEDIDYGEALQKVEEIAKRMNEIGGSDVSHPDKDEQNRLREEYFKLEQEMERYNSALMMTEEYQAEQDRVEKQWEDDNKEDNLAALRAIRRHMPVKIRHMSEADLTNTPTPNGKFIPNPIAKKFKRTNVLQCIRLDPSDLERMHPSTLENMRVTGLTLTERRALYAHLQVLGPKWEKNKSEKMTERKWTWYQMMKSNFKENLAPYKRHIDQFGPPGNHSCTAIGKQCPIKADKILDYSGDYGFTEKAEYEVSEIRKADVDDPGAKAMAEAAELAKVKKANERADILKKHYKGKLLQVSKANGSCESMDDAMDKMENHMLKWIEFVMEKGEKPPDTEQKKELANFTEALNELKLASLDYAQRSGMQTSGKKKAGGDKPDIRSSVEASLAEEVYEWSQEFFAFISSRMKITGALDTRITKTIELLSAMLAELHAKNIEIFKELGVKRSDRSRKLKKVEDMKKEVEEKMKPKEEEEPPNAAPSPPKPPLGSGRGGGRGDLLAALGRGRGRGGGDDGGGGGGRGGLMAAIQGGRGRGGRGGGADGGRGGLMAAIQGRGAGGGGGGADGGGGRGGLLAAIQAKSAGRGGGGGDGDGGGGRGGLLAAIQARGGG